MRKAIIAIVLLAVAAAGFSLDVSKQLEKKVILLKDGTAIPVDRTWVVGQDIFCEREKAISLVHWADVRTIQNRDVDYVISAYANRLEQLTGRAQTASLRVVEAGGEWVRKAPVSLIVMAAGALSVAGLLFGLRFLRAWQQRKRAVPRTQAALAGRSPGLPQPHNVVRFFLELYRHQLGAPQNAPVEAELLDTPAPRGNKIYELRVRHADEWIKRRMTIGPLGEDSGSKSKCYYVIFDRHLVVKIPPRPVTDFEEYVAGIKKESLIMERLAPKVCIVPNVSAILQEVHRLETVGEVSAEHLEEHYIALLRKATHYQDYLKINGSFAYFMDLSRHFFLGAIIDGFHDHAEAMRAEIASTLDLVHYPEKFKERYGEKHEEIGFEIRDLLNQFEVGVRQLSKTFDGAPHVTSDLMKRWVIQYLEHRDIKDAGGSTPPGLSEAIRRILGQLFKKHASVVDQYLDAVEEFSGRLVLEQNKPMLCGIVTNLLDLLAWLNIKNVAMRDLKPDNLLVAGDPECYPSFLRCPADYSLGFIDVETAVYLDKGADGSIRQPMLGGTPYYATPSHLFSNSVLQNCFSEVRWILHLQDWHAVLVMITKTVSGKLLFQGTAKIFVEVKNRVIRTMKQRAPMEEIVKEASHTFWLSAVTEFRAKMKAEEAVLKWLEVQIPANAGQMFIQVLQTEITAIERGRGRVSDVLGQELRPGGRERFLQADRQQLCWIMAKLESDARRGGGNAAAVHPTLRQLNRLATLTSLLERKRDLLARLKKSAPVISVYELQLFMFNVLLKSMYREHWGPLTEQPASVVTPADDLSLATTV
jgi:hypothetical protein